MCQFVLDSWNHITVNCQQVTSDDHLSCVKNWPDDVIYPRFWEPHIRQQIRVISVDCFLFLVAGVWRDKRCMNRERGTEKPVIHFFLLPRPQKSNGENKAAKWPHPCDDYLSPFVRCPWCSRYRRRKWTRRYEFKSWTILIAFHIALIPLGKVWIQLFSLQLWVNSRTD